MLRYHTTWQRFWAAFLDSCVFIPLGWLNLAIWSHTQNATILVGWVLIQSLISCLYSVWMHARYGQTLGKMICRIKVLDISENALSLRQAVLRDLVTLLSTVYFTGTQIFGIVSGKLDSHGFSADYNWNLLTGISFAWLIVELVSMFTNEKRRAIHDIWAGTVVVRYPWNEKKKQYNAEVFPFRKTVLKILIVLMATDFLVSQVKFYNEFKRLGQQTNKVRR